MKDRVTKFLSDPLLMPLAMAVIAAMALGTALISQYFFGLHPCVLCIFQRWPYGIVIFMGFIAAFYRCYGEALGGEFVSSKVHDKTSAGFMSVIGLAFLANSIIAVYHTGVEQKWWKSFLEGCAVPELKGDMAQILADIQARGNAARCDEIPWADPIFNLSMANYNVIFCLGLGIIALISARLIWTKKAAS